MNNVEIYIDNQIIDLKDDEDIVQSFAVNKFGDISTRNSSYSNTFKLPVTARNRAVFENPDVVVNDSTIPYQQLDCTIFVDGIPAVVGFGQLIKAGGFYDLKVFGTNFDFYSAIKGKELNELDLSAYTHDWTLANITASRFNTSGYIYGLIDYLTVPDNTFFGVTDRIINPQILYPGMFLHTLIDKIITEAGFTKSGAIFSNPNYLNVILPFSNDILRREVESQLFKVGTTQDQIFLYAGAPALTQQTAIFDDETSPGFFDNGGHWNASTYRYTATDTVTMAFAINVNILSSLSNIFYVKLRKNGSIIQQGGWVSQTGVFTYTFTPISLVAGDYVDVIYTPSALSTPTIGAEVVRLVADMTTFQNAAVENMNYGDSMNMSLNIMDIKQGELFKWFLQMFQAVVQVKAGVVYVKTFAEIIDNIPNAKDWSDKVDETEPEEIEFNIGVYAQSNKFKYLEDDSVIKPEGTDYQLLIANENLEAEMDLIVAPFAATEMVTRLDFENIPNIKLSTIGATVNPNSKVKPRLLILKTRDVDDAILFDDNVTGSEYVNISVPFMHFILPGEQFNLGFEDSLIPLYGEDVVDILQEQKIVSQLMRINSLDINQLDFFIPVWIEKYKCYFFLSDIKQYKVNRTESTVVELIKLPS